jgi:carbon monoxide dehydrogenase subunit G
MEADPTAPVYSEGSIGVDATPEQVWDLMADFEAWPAWNPDVDTVSLEGPVATGSVFRWKAGSARLVSTLRVVERPTRLSWTGRTMGINAVHDWRFERAGTGTTVSMRESFDGMVAKLLKGKLQRDLDRTTENGLSALKAAVEARALD